ncbi:glucosamine--fructose-6-phosphate aminotransferase [Photobacterium iliopiscarium]|jgi:glucosamine--fructose-6-phosphate aminotransferase (isomerizing)|uniref:Glutamine--fructose-6-phosphate aminotransferase [isomerizing] n=1 Tax=Photobacterium iliopiscarium TaxID=56192 RepID=A0A0D8P4I0_9GAMM|nr:glutamine--fructose-6-phosphate transaminase (isomerizing) [Photobacterium iliopiscarium]KJG12797.1 glucosamine--fructose-6-phosphate aminotransferase [Photobacterium iliopiscarium]KJG21995.1 glucosamine--fructose-6-phosphate aminotransferase [Photobacterium iliopiscarium]PST88476.1 glutamine--fructose-6-phosphate transaminase (isomerizing) [Photobacterium iliopiscarium]PST98304.1 glutamine--fructose-6-phosphate transaminase (isomerizing) [Photobacterium iliopiscarium]PSV80259.1 glutamine--
MCGIVGAVAQRDVAEILIEGLRRLEYRGYDSAGIAIVDTNNELQRVRRLGKVQELADAVDSMPLSGGTGIAHTRWATHGEPSEANAHPHISGQHIALVHNGIIENHQSLRELLLERGYVFSSQTDTEVIAHLVDWELRSATSLLEAVQKTVLQLQGAYGTVVMDSRDPERIVVARSGSPLVIGLGVGENFIASDQLALLNVTRRFMFLEEGDVAEVTRRTISVFDNNGQAVERAVNESTVEHDAADKGQYRHFMQKEIFEQPSALINTMEGRISDDHVIVESIGSDATTILENVEHIQIIACGTSYNAGMVARYWFESIAGVSCDVEIASEFRYRKFVTQPNSLLITLSQSGETADTLAALRLAKQKGYMAAMTICNVAGSSLVRESDLAFMTRAGAEIGVASTKAFTTQLVALLMLVTALGKQKGNIDRVQEQQIVTALHQLPTQIEKALAFDKPIEVLAEDFADKQHALFLGRGEFYPIAVEASLKLKEISYIHAEAYAAGELKHGPLALVDAEMPVIVVAPTNDLLEKLKSNIEEVRARGGLLYVFADDEAGFEECEGMKIITMPKVDEIIAPIFYTIPMQLLSYHVALIKGTDVDQPRNLAKAVTVE